MSAQYIEGTDFHRGTLSEGMNAAIGGIKERYAEMIEGWRRG
jgi:hypothetical protein